jgi:hypothetical protein
LNIVEGKRSRISFVIEPRYNSQAESYYPMAYAYLNGKISGAVLYDVDAHHFYEVPEGPATLNIDSSDAQIKIYGIRFYSTALSDSAILNNYTAS